MRRCVFLDRDGVINEKPPAGEYISKWEDIQLIPSVADWIRLFNSLDYLVIVVTNQRGVSLGRMTEEELEAIHQRLLIELEAAGAHVDDLFYCPHEDESCGCRKPQPGLIRLACKKWDIDLAHSVMIGDSSRDRGLAEMCGIRFVSVDHGRVLEVVNFGPHVPL
jgi:D-glycero-D-manno-heptose 1,7-bisphosphate phosphatase